MKEVDLERYKSMLVEMRARLIREVSDLEEAIREDVVKPGDVSTAPTHQAVFDSEGLERDVAVAQNEQGILEQVETALQRIERGDFGRCQECGEEIPLVRLDAIPYTPNCVQCAERLQRGATTHAVDEPVGRSAETRP